MPWLHSTKEAFLLSHPSVDKRPSAPEEDELLIEAQEDSGQGTALALPKGNLAGKLLGTAFPALPCVPAPFPPVLPAAGRAPVTGSTSC